MSQHAILYHDHPIYMAILAQIDFFAGCFYF